MGVISQDSRAAPPNPNAQTVAKRIHKIANNSDARDKICRVIQYTCTTVASSAGIISHTDAAFYSKKFSRLDYDISMARKLFKLGKCVEVFHTIANGTRISDWILLMLVTSIRTTLTSYLLLDHMLWLVRAGLVPIDEESTTKLYNQIWMILCIFHFVRNAYISLYPHSSSLKVSLYQARALSIILDTAVNMCDILLPIDSLGHCRIPGIILGITGVISSFISLSVIWNPNLELKL